MSELISLRDNLLSSLPQNLQNQLQILKNNLPTKRAYLVGGVVRDLLLNAPINDLDIEVYDINLNEFEKIMKSIGAVGVGKSFFVYKFGDIDVSLPRIETKVGDLHNSFEVSITQDERTASSRRDFTLNAMMINIFTGGFLDFHSFFYKKS